ncbi:MAG: peroxidase family protein [Actinomycetota bacterium]
MSRRAVLGAAGVGVGAVAVTGTGVAIAQGGRGRARGDGDPDGDGNGRRRPGDGDGRGGRRRRGGDGPDVDRFTRMFDEPVFAEPRQELTEALEELGRVGGIMDANDPLELGAVRLITEPDLSPNNPDNPFNTAGVTFVGQFLDHDITRDAGSRLGSPESLRRSVNLRSARFDLDSVYGGGPGEMRQLYTDADPFVLRVESGGRFEDLPRDATGSAILGDNRNDENLMLSGLHAAWLLFHNAVQERVRATGRDDEAAFAEAQRLVRWHYQWMIVHEWLPQMVGPSMVNDILANGRQFYTPNTPRIPVEFQTAAYRFGHSLVRPSYRANLAGDDGDAFFGFVFDPTGLDDPDNPDPDDLGGGHRAPRRFIGWQTFFDFGDGEVRNNKRVDTTLSTPLFQLPLFTLPNDRGEAVGPTSLAARNLLRHTTWELPSGQRLASVMGEPGLTAGDLSDLSGLGANLQTSTPLWFYILREADLMADGMHLGPVGGRIVAEVFLGLLQMDDDSWLSADPGWQPELPMEDASSGYRTTDFLRLAGVDPATRGE